MTPIIDCIFPEKLGSHIFELHKQRNTLRTNLLPIPKNFLQIQRRNHRMNGSVKIASTFVRIEIDWKERSSNDAKCMTLPFRNYFCLWLLKRYELNIQSQLSIYISKFIHRQSSFEETHLIDIYLLILNIKPSTTFRIMNLRVKKLLFSSISGAFDGSRVFLRGFDFF